MTAPAPPHDTPRHAHHPRLNQFSADDGASILVQVCGEGRPVILLHEWTGEHGLWRPFIGPLSDHCRVFAWDARGHGSRHSGAGGGPATVDRMALDLAQLIERHRLDRPVIIGHSMGALTLWRHIDLFGDGHLGGICVLDQSPKLVTDDDWTLGIYGDFPAARSQAFAESLRRDFPATVLRLVADGLNDRARQQIERNSQGIQKLRARLASLDPNPLITSWESLCATDFRPALAKITAPTLLVYGAASNFYARAVAEHVHAAIAGSELLIYPDADHSPHQGDRDRFTADSLAFIARVDGEG